MPIKSSKIKAFIKNKVKNGLKLENLSPFLIIFDVDVMLFNDTFFHECYIYNIFPDLFNILVMAV
ncbi:hypothetical protein WR164_02080 [Philodulcilactobacillus myokoensis]|uniref:Uncharacterized protein n=1 Tax=Philodulcilactobacillus myokoensis TaxID=2929573 RepID=A0A9W6B154_9LACO|nr:hypothetical protein WR164_02080 [Philodulcilactobacillus myokoensis]